MGQGGRIVIYNGTSYDWNQTDQSSYQMNSWNFPETIESGASKSVYVEWDQSFHHTTSDDSARVTYSVNGKRFEIHATARHGFNIKVDFLDDFSAYAKPGSPHNLGWKHDGKMLFMLAGNDQNRYWTNKGTAKGLFYDQRDLLKDARLTEVCLPGSHDSGMSMSKHGTIGASDCNTVTQHKTIKEQLDYGTRYFDIRPVIGGGKFHTGHYSEVKGVWLGARGQSINQVMDDINSFTEEGRWEPIILDLSHAYDTDNGYRDFSPDQWNELLGMLAKGITRIYRRGPNDPSTSPMDLTLQELLYGPKKSAVIIRIPSGLAGVEPPTEAFQVFDLYDEYSNTNDFASMRHDQLKKMEEDTPSNYFKLCWTLTQDALQASTCSLSIIGGQSILGLSGVPNARLIESVFNEVDYRKRHFPNIISLDGIQTCDSAILSYAINVGLFS